MQQNLRLLPTLGTPLLQGYVAFHIEDRGHDPKGSSSHIFSLLQGPYYRRAIVLRSTSGPWLRMCPPLTERMVAAPAPCPNKNPLIQTQFCYSSYGLWDHVRPNVWTNTDAMLHQKIVRLKKIYVLCAVKNLTPQLGSSPMLLERPIRGETLPQTPPQMSHILFTDNTSKPSTHKFTTIQCHHHLMHLGCKVHVVF